MGTLGFKHRKNIGRFNFSQSVELIQTIYISIKELCQYESDWDALLHAANLVVSGAEDTDNSAALLQGNKQTINRADTSIL